MNLKCNTSRTDSIEIPVCDRQINSRVRIKEEISEKRDDH